MISFLLFVLNLTLWVWLIGFLITIPVIVRHIFVNEDSFTVGHLLWIPFTSACWFLQLPDIVEELEEIFDIDVEEIFERIVEHELFKIKKS